jgi:hypothetical protein
VKTFQVTVREVNVPPLFPPIESRWVHAGTTLVVTNVATDPDIPANAVMFGAAMPLPSGASVEPTSGVLTWHVPDSSIETTNVIAIRVTDNGSPSLSVTNTFVVRASPRPRVQAQVTAAGGIELRWTGIPGWRYQVQYADEVDATTWTDVGEPVVALSGEIVVEQPRISAQRFFRLVLLE